MSVKIEVTGDTAADVREEFARLFGWTEHQMGAYGSSVTRRTETGVPQPVCEPEDKPEPQPADVHEESESTPPESDDEGAPAPATPYEELYGGSGKVRSTNAQQLKNEIVARIENGQVVADDQIGRLPAKEKEAVREAQRNAAPAETASEPEPEQPAEPEATPEPAAEEPAGDNQGEQKYSLDDVQTEIIRIHKDLGDPGLTKAREVFSKHGNGATKRSQIPAECVDAVVTALKEIGGS